MPGRDGSGPVGAGPMTGGGFGYCTGYDNRQGNCRFGFGRGFQGNQRISRRPARFARNFYSQEPASLTHQEEKQFLHNEADRLQNQLNAVRKRLDEFENQEK
jgi:hypothetical protein